MVLCVRETWSVTLFWQVRFRQGCSEHLDQRQLQEHEETM
jgi:hypothetical protein